MLGTSIGRGGCGYFKWNGPFSYTTTRTRDFDCFIVGEANKRKKEAINIKLNL